MLRMTMAGATGLTLSMAQPAAAQMGQWHTYQHEGACVAEYQLDKSTVSLTRKFGGVASLTYSFSEEELYQDENLKYEISIPQRPDHQISIESFPSEDYFEVRSDVAFTIEASVPLLDWIEASNPAYSVTYSGEKIETFRFSGITEARRLLATCTPTIREANRAPKPASNRANWFNINKLMPFLEGLSGSRWVAARLAVNTDGRVQGCTITASTGSPSADAAMCNELTSRAKLHPATDSNGGLVDANYDYRVTLQL